MSPTPNSKPLLEFFTRSLTAFQSSSDPFRVLCTLPHHNGTILPRPLSSSSTTTSKSSSLTILDSSFNPPTRAHMSMLRSARPQRVLLLLSVNNADKAAKPASFEQRLSMMEIFAREFLQGQHPISAGAEEAEGGEVQVDVGVTTRPYFHDKAAAIAQSGFYGSTGEQVFLAGFDTLIRIFDGKYYKEEGGLGHALGPFFASCRLRITTRPDGTWGDVGEQRRYLEKLGGDAVEGVEAGWLDRIDMVDGEEEDEGVSSSRVREIVKGAEGGLEMLVGREVREWVEREGLYRYD